MYSEGMLVLQLLENWFIYVHADTGTPHRPHTKMADEAVNLFIARIIQQRRLEVRGCSYSQSFILHIPYYSVPFTH